MQIGEAKATKRRIMEALDALSLKSDLGTQLIKNDLFKIYNINLNCKTIQSNRLKSIPQPQECHLEYDEKEAMEHVIKIANEQTEKILQLYVYAPNENQIVVNFKDYSNEYMITGYYQLKNIGDDIFYGDFEVEQKKLNICVSCNGQTISHFVSSQSVISLIKIQSGSSPTLNEITILNHLIKTTNDWTSFQLAVRAAEDIRTEIREALSGQNNLTINHKLIFHQLVLKRLLIIDWRRNYLNTFDDSNKLKNELPPWDFFVIMKFMSQEYGTNLNASVYNILTKCLENYQKVSNLSHLDLFCLIPCFNYLRSIQSNISDTRFFNDQNIESQEELKENNMKEMILDILQTELRICQSKDITPEIFTEAYVFQLLYIQQDHKLSHSILQFLFEQNEQMFTRKLVSICKDIIERVSFEVYMKVFEIIYFFFELSHNKNYFLYINKKKIKNNKLQFADVTWFENVNWKKTFEL
ncbi:hypothetical protein RFI_34741 [Reticulomyxa filosa]|uniref:Uncharacterized protein n=1 Tax=Reticulomyxa filosa TaxID=46433 RepID=X6LND9_RETFI|nr:hypothetical protein RFI_34741 [Reticulomyxa filosa]|eukprot:ETO02677.1 hypothetical protein RFI_34741 [Reticulomyxa filosa]